MGAYARWPGVSELIEAADETLVYAKQNGRRGVTQRAPELTTGADDAQPEALSESR